MTEKITKQIKKRHYSKERNLKISQTLKGRHNDHEWKKGHPSFHTEESRKKLSISLKGNTNGFKKGHKGYLTPEHYKILSKLFKNRVYKQEWKDKISKAKKGTHYNVSHEQARHHGIMACLKSKRKDTKPERLFEALLIKKNIEYRKQIAIPYKNPITVCDFYLPNNKTIIFVDGDYWHTLYKKVVNDWKIDKYLTNSGYNVSRFWESEIENNNIVDKLI